MEDLQDQEKKEEISMEKSSHYVEKKVISSKENEKKEAEDFSSKMVDEQ